MKRKNALLQENNDEQVANVLGKLRSNFLSRISIQFQFKIGKTSHRVNVWTNFIWKALINLVLAFRECYPVGLGGSVFS